MTAATQGQADEPEIPVRLVQLWLCDLCLDGAGSECHTPGCALWLDRPPERSIRDYVKILAAQDARPAPELRGALDTLVANWHDYSKYQPTDTHDEITEHAAVEECAGELDAILDEHPDATAKPAPELAAADLKAAVVAEIREAASCESDDGDECRKCSRHADAILAAIKRAGLPS